MPGFVSGGDGGWGKGECQEDKKEFVPLSLNALVGALFLVTRGNASKHDTTSHDLCLSAVVGGDAGLGGVNNGLLLLLRCSSCRALTAVLAASTRSRGERSEGGNAGRWAVALLELLLLSLELLLLGVSLSGLEDGVLLGTRDYGSSACPAECTARSSRTIFGRAAGAAAAERGRRVVAAGAWGAFHAGGVKASLLLLMRSDVVECAVGAVSGVMGRRIRRGARVIRGTGSAHGDSLHLWDWDWSSQSRWLAVGRRGSPRGEPGW